MLTNELIPIYDGRKSFYGKAKVVVYPKAWIDLESYSTIVCRFDRTDGSFEFYGDYSITTRCHTWEFLLQVSTEYMISTDTWIKIYDSICEQEMFRSFPQFLRAVRKVDPRGHTYTLRNGKTFDYYLNY